MDRETPQRSRLCVQFHLIVTCILFLSRQGFRRACLRADLRCNGASAEENAAKLLKLAWITFPIGIFVTVSACILVFWWQALRIYNPYGQAILILGLDPERSLKQHSRKGFMHIKVLQQPQSKDLHVFWSYWQNPCIEKHDGLRQATFKDVYVVHPTIYQKATFKDVYVVHPTIYQKIGPQEGEKMILVWFDTTYNQAVYGL